MKKHIETTPNAYGFGHDWTLVVDFKSFGVVSRKRFFLGQDSKFCSRVLGVNPRQIQNVIGTNDLSVHSNRVKLANYIYRSLELNHKKVRTLEVWEICAQ